MTAAPPVERSRGARTVLAHAPTRLDFGGGWTDVPPYSDEAGGFVCNVAIARHAVVRLGDGAPQHAGPDDAAAYGAPLVRAALRRAGLDGLAATVASDFPVGAGLGGSSAAGVALAAALARWRGERPAREALAEWSRAVEVDELGIAGGRQDHYAAALGGALGLRFGPDGVTVRRLALAAETAAELERRCVVVYTGEARVSARTITGVLDAYRARDAHVCAALARMAELAERMADTLEEGRLDDLGRLVGEHWTWQRSLHPAIPTRVIDALLERAAAAGALGGKALGASGGGCVLAIAPADGVEAVRAAMAELAPPLPFALDHAGVRVDEPEGA